MILHYLKIVFRQMAKRKVQTAISILGITAGLLCFSVCNYYNRIFSTGNKDLATYENQAEICIKERSYQVNIPIEDFEKKIGKDKFEAVAFYVNSSSTITLDETVYCKVDKTECNADYFDALALHRRRCADNEERGQSGDGRKDCEGRGATGGAY